MTGPSIEDTIAWLIQHADRSASAEVIFYDGTEQRRYRARVWRDGTIAFRPVK